jgi:hypothetical protein
MAVKKFLNENGKQVWPITRADCVYNVAGDALLSDVVDDEVQARKDADEDLQDAIDAEVDRVDGIIGVASVEGAQEATGLHKKIEDADKANAAAIAQEVIDRNAAIEEAAIFENGITTVNALGGIPANQSLDGMSVTEILDMLLFPYVKQTISNVKGSPNGGTFECGNNQVITSVQATVTKKSKKITKVELLQGSTVLATKEGDEVANGGTFTFSGLSVAVNSVNVQLKVKAYDETGASAEGTTGAFTFVYPYYYGICAAGAEINEALVEGLTKEVASKGQKAYSYTTNNQCAVIAFPKSHGVLKSALDPNSFENIGAFTKHEVPVTGLDGKTVAYYVYVSGAFTGSGFKYTFKY